MSVVVQISDTHFGTEQLHIMRALRRLVEQERPQLLILSGDITQRARSQQFASALRYLDTLPVETRLVLPGNHDIPLENVLARALWPYRGHRRTFGHELEPCYESTDVLAIGVNTTRPWRHKHGEVSARQIDRVARRLQQAQRQQLRIVVTHQPVDVPTPQDEHNLLRGREAAVREWSAAGADLILGGHIHLPYILCLRDRFTDLPRKLWCVQAGTALSTRVRRRAPNSVNIIRHSHLDEPPYCVVERWDHIDSLHRFDKIEHQALKLDR